MGFLDVSQAVRTRLTVRNPTVNPIAWDAFGGRYDDKPTVDRTTPTNSLWLRPSIAYTEGQSVYGSDSVWDNGEGVIAVQVFSPFGLSTDADELLEQTADAVAEIFAHRSFAGVHCRGAYPQYAVDPDGTWQQVTVQVPFIASIRRVKGFEMEELSGRMILPEPSHELPAVPPILALRMNSGAIALADAATEKAAQFILVQTYGDLVLVATHGLQGFTNGHGVGSSGDMWLGDAGAIVTTEPNTGFAQPLGAIRNANLLLVAIGNAEFR